MLNTRHYYVRIFLQSDCGGNIIHGQIESIAMGIKSTFLLAHCFGPKTRPASQMCVLSERQYLHLSLTEKSFVTESHSEGLRDSSRAYFLVFQLKCHIF